MPRMRTIAAAINHFKSIDPNTDISEYFLRRQLKNGKLKHLKAGNKYLIDLDYLEEYFSNPPAHDGDVDSIVKFKRIRP